MGGTPEIITLYGGLVTLEYDDAKHAYRYNGVVVPGVTSVTGIKDKPFLIPWALKMAGNYLLENWPEEPSARVTREAVVKAMKQAHRKVRDTAADYGKQAHEWVENRIKAQLSMLPDPVLPTIPEVLSAVRAFLAWEEEHRVHYLASEKKIFSLAHQYAGTLDILANIDGEDTLLDLKTSNSYHDEYGLQTAAYCMAHNEETRENVKERVVLMLHKETAQFDPVVLPSSRFDRDVSGFLGALQLWKWAEEEKAWRKS